MFAYTPSTLPILHLSWMLPPHNEKTVTTLTSSYIFLVNRRHFHGDSSLPSTYTDSLRFRWSLSYWRCFMDCWFGKHVRSLVFLVLCLHRHTNSLACHNYICNANLRIRLNYFFFPLQCYLYTEGDLLQCTLLLASSHWPLLMSLDAVSNPTQPSDHWSVMPCLPPDAPYKIDLFLVSLCHFTSAYPSRRRQ